MHETGIYDLTEFYNSNFLIRTLKNKITSSSKSTQKIALDQFKFHKQNQFNIISIDLRLDHFKLAIKFWIIGFCVALVCLISEFVTFNTNINCCYYINSLKARFEKHNFKFSIFNFR